MSELSMGQKIAWFLYQKGMGVAKPEFLFVTKAGDEQWLKIVDVLIKDNHLEGRNLALDQLLQPRNFRNHPKRFEFLKLMGRFLNKGILDERRRVVSFISDNASFFQEKDDILMGPLITAQRDHDTITATKAEEALLKIRGEVKRTKDDFR